MVIEEYCVRTRMVFAYLAANIPMGEQDLVRHRPPRFNTQVKEHLKQLHRFTCGGTLLAQSPSCFVPHKHSPQRPTTTTSASPTSSHQPTWTCVLTVYCRTTCDLAFDRMLLCSFHLASVCL